MLNRKIWLIPMYQVFPYIKINDCHFTPSKIIRYKVNKLASMWMKCLGWPPRRQQVLHQRWIFGIGCMQATKHASEGIHPGFETQTHITRSPKRVSVAKQKGFNLYEFPEVCPPNFLSKSKQTSVLCVIQIFLL